MRCSSCGQDIKPGGNFCPYCGARIRRKVSSVTRHASRKRNSSIFVILLIVFLSVFMLFFFLSRLGEHPSPKNLGKKRERPYKVSPLRPILQVQPPEHRAKEPPSSPQKQQPLWKKELEELKAELERLDKPSSLAAFVRRLDRKMVEERGEFAKALEGLRTDAEKKWRTVSLKKVGRLLEDVAGKKDEVAVEMLQKMRLTGLHKDAKMLFMNHLAELHRRIEERRQRNILQNKEIEGLRAEIGRLYKAGEFGSTAEKARRLCQLLKKWDRTGEEVYVWAQQIWKKASVFAQIVERIPRSPLADHKGIWRIELQTKAVHYGRILSDDGYVVKYRKEGGVTITIGSEKIRSKRPVSPKEYREYLDGKLSRRIARLRGRYLRLYTECVVFARRYGLDEKLAPLLERVFQIQGSEHLVEILFGRGATDVVVTLLEGVGRHNDARAYKEKLAMREAMAEKIPEVPGMKPQQRDELLDALDAEKRAEDLIRKAINEFGRARFRLGRKALKELRRAQAVLKRLFNAYPDSKFLEQKLVEVTSNIGFVQKVLTGFGK